MPTRWLSCWRALLPAPGDEHPRPPLRAPNPARRTWALVPAPGLAYAPAPAPSPYLPTRRFIQRVRSFCEAFLESEADTADISRPNRRKLAWHMAKSIARWEPGRGNAGGAGLPELHAAAADCIRNFVRDQRLRLFGEFQEKVNAHNAAAGATLAASDHEAWQQLVVGPLALENPQPQGDAELREAQRRLWGPTANTTWLRSNNLRALR